MKSLAGHFLVASPRLPDENFFRTVVLVIQHDESGAYGLVLNRPTSHQLKDVLPWGEEIGEVGSHPLYWGGPVDGPLMVLHTEADCADVDVLPGLFVAVNRDKIHRLLDSSTRHFRVYDGYSGWGPGQLDRELELGGWLTAPARVDDVFAEPDGLWRKTVTAIGRQILGPTLTNGPLPEDPSLN